MNSSWVTRTRRRVVPSHGVTILGGDAVSSGLAAVIETVGVERHPLAARVVVRHASGCRPVGRGASTESMR